MNTSSKLKIALTSAVAIGFAGITYVAIKKSLKQKTSSIAPDNLNINLITSEEDSEDAVNELRRFVFLLIYLLYLFFIYSLLYNIIHIDVVKHIHMEKNLLVQKKLNKKFKGTMPACRGRLNALSNHFQLFLK